MSLHSCHSSITKKGDAKVSLEFAGHGFDILVHNPDKLEPGDAQVKRALCDDVKVENVTGNSVRIPKHAIEMLSTDKCHTVVDIHRVIVYKINSV